MASLSPSVESPATSTQARLLDAAERLFAEQGFGRASVRAITRAAGANLAAVHYHFGSKEDLLHAVLARRLRPLNGRRLELLAACSGGGRGLELRCVLRALVLPVLQMAAREPGGEDFCRLLGRLFTEPDETMRSLMVSEFQEVIDAFVAALAEARPELDAREAFWRFHFTIGSMAYAAGLGRLVSEYSGGLCDGGDPEKAADHLVAFLIGGWKGPASGSPADEARA